jgi:hypothetical protein
MLKQAKQYRNNQEGIVLVMALMILTVVLVSVLALSRILLNEVKMSINLNNSMVSFYSAESGIEKSLYYIKYSRQQNDFASFDSLDTIGSNIYTLGEVEDGQSVTIAMSTTTAADFYQYNVTTSSPAHVNIIDPAGDISNIDWGAGQIEYQYRVYWELEDCFPSKVNHRIEITDVSFSDNFTEPYVKTYVRICDCAYDSNQCNDDLTALNALTNKFHRFSFRPLDSTIRQLSFDLDAGNIGILSEADIEVYGNYKNSQYYIKVRLPSLNPVSNVFDYVIFSEEELIKDL